MKTVELLDSGNIPQFSALLSREEVSQKQKTLQSILLSDDIGHLFGFLTRPSEDIYAISLEHSFDEYRILYLKFQRLNSFLMHLALLAGCAATRMNQLFPMAFEITECQKVYASCM